MRVARARRPVFLLCAVSVLVAAVVTPAASNESAGPRRVILMIADGAGYNTWEATACYRGNRGEQFHDAPGWLTMGVSTHALRDAPEIGVSAEHALTQHPSLVYDPARAWDTTPIEGETDGYPYYFAGYRWLRHAPDSACTATALVTGKKTYEGAINVDGRQDPIEETLPWLAHRAGMRTGTVSSVPLNDATPAAGGGAHSDYRWDLCPIAWEMFTTPVLDVIAGAGHPHFDNNGRPIEDENARIYRDVGDRAIWDALTGRGRIKPGDPVCAAAADESGEASEVRVATRAEVEALERWVVKQTKAEIEAAGSGPLPDKLLLLPEVGRMGYWGGGPPDPHGPQVRTIGGTLQQKRGSRADPKYTAPGDDPLIPTVPTLESLALAALNALDDDPDGFFLNVEGGAVDWAMHRNQMGRMVEEMIDFEQTVLAVVNWIETHGGWERTLLVVTADHDHLLAGPEADEIPFQALTDNGAGRLPLYKWFSSSHSNHLVPVFARGAGVEQLPELVRGEDPFRGDYVDQTDLFRVMRSTLLGDDTGRSGSTKAAGF